MNSKKIILLAIVCFIFGTHKLKSQGAVYVNTEWQDAIGNPVFNPILNPFGLQWSNSLKTPGGGLILVGHTFVSGQGENVLLTSYDADGNVLFSVDYDSGSSNNDYGINLATDGSGNIYVCGTTDNGGTTDYDILILKYDPSGSLINNNTYAGGANLNDIGISITFNSNNNMLYVGGTTENASTTYDYLILKFNPSTFVLLNSNSYDYASLIDVPSGIEIGPGGDICLIGASASSNIDWDYAVATFNPANLSFVSDARSNVPGIGYDQPLAFCKDANQNIYITGRASTDGVNYDIRTIKILSNLTTIAWTQTYDGSGLEDVGNTIAVDANGDVIVGGFETKINGIKNAKFLKYSGTSGSLIWEKSRPSINPTGDALIKSLAINQTNGGIYYLGSERNLAGDKQVLVGKIKPNGEDSWLKIIKSNSQDVLPSDLQTIGNEIYTTTLVDLASNYYQITKYTELEIDTAAEYNSGVPSRLKRHLLVRFQQSVVKPASINNKDLVHGKLEDFIDSTSLVLLEDITRLKEIENYKCYKVLPWMTMDDSLSVTRSGRTIKIMHHYTTLGIILPGNTPDSTVLSKFSSAVSVVNHAQFNGFLQLNVGANDIEYNNGNSAALKTTTAITNANINVEPAWDLSTGSSSIKVGVYDTGINFLHLDFGNGTFAGSRIAGGFNYYDNIQLYQYYSNDVFGHGTAVADKIGALRNNNYGVAGVAGGDGGVNAGVSIFDMKLFGLGNACNFSNTFFAGESQAYNAIVQGASSSGFGLHIQNHSWAGGGLYGVILDGFITAYQNEVVLVVASGNNADITPCNPISYPSTYKDHMVMKVGANDATGGRAIFSACGNGLDFIAPGTNDLYTSLSRTGTTLTDTLYWPPNPTVCNFKMNGTSFSAPYASGTAALLLSYANNTILPNGLYPEDIEQLLQLSAKDLTVSPYSIGYDSQTGYGRVDAGQTMNNYYYPGYIVQHHTFTVSASSAVPVGSPFENTCLREQMFGQPFGIGKVQRYKITGTNSHSIPTGYDYLDGWELNAGSNLMGINSSYGSPLPIQCQTVGVAFFESRYLPDATNIVPLTITSTGASFEGYIYRIIDTLTNQTAGWYPFDTTGIATFAYSTYLRSKTVGINETSFTENSLSVYPNPTDGKLYFKSRLVGIDKIDVEVFSVVGSLVFRTENLYIYDGNYIDISGLMNGVYFAKMKYGSKTLVKKIILSR